jgi:hypothetical protein
MKCEKSCVIDRCNANKDLFHCITTFEDLIDKKLSPEQLRMKKLAETLKKYQRNLERNEKLRIIKKLELKEKGLNRDMKSVEKRKFVVSNRIK